MNRKDFKELLELHIGDGFTIVDIELTERRVFTVNCERDSISFGEEHFIVGKDGEGILIDYKVVVGIAI